MKRLLLMSLFLIVTSCGVNVDSNVNVDVSKFKVIKYKKACFIVVSSRKDFRLNSSGLGITYVPCKEVDSLVR